MSRTKIQSSSAEKNVVRACRSCVSRLVGKDITGAFKAKAQPGTLLRVGDAVVLFCLRVKVTSRTDRREWKSC